MTNKNLRKMENKSTIYIKYIDSINHTSEGLYATKKHDNRWQCGNALLSNKQIISIYNKIEEVINNNWSSEGFQYWM